MIGELERAAGRPVSRETLEKLEAYVASLTRETARQNLISASTLDRVWERHILDSAQLVRFEPKAGASWVDIGSGAGLPGIVIACLVDGRVTLAEPRRLRAEFLHTIVDSLELNATVHCAKVERIAGGGGINLLPVGAPLVGALHHRAPTRGAPTRHGAVNLPAGRPRREPRR